MISVACQSTGPKLPKFEPTPVPVNPIPAKTLSQMLEAANRALEEDRLVFPEDGSALSIYRNILGHYPTQNQALRGMDNIVERYLVLANQAAEQGRLASARSMLARARLVNENHPGITTTHNRIERLSNTKPQVISLKNSEIRSRSARLGKSLTQLGRRAKSLAAQVIITARSDADGRWIYQQMKKGQGDERIRAQLQIGSPANVSIQVTRPDS